LIFRTNRDEVNEGAVFGFPWRKFMRRTVYIVVCVLVACFYAGLNAQIPENAQFQPGSYAVPYHRPTQLAPYESPVASADEDEEEADASQTEWEKKFSPQTEISPPPVSLPPYEVPHLQFAYNHRTGRFHITPYEPGYAANPSAFPIQTSPLHIWISSKSAASQPSPQVPYMSYYDPDPVILPAEIRLRGSRLAAPFTQIQPIPLPVPRPETAQPAPRVRLGERLRQTFGAFIVP
jgi:hypothetical protein